MPVMRRVVSYHCIGLQNLVDTLNKCVPLAGNSPVCWHVLACKSVLPGNVCKMASESKGWIEYLLTKHYYWYVFAN